MFQFYAITFGSSFFNMVLGYVKFATAIGFMQNTKTSVFVAYIGIVITSTMEWIYSFIIVMNNMFIFVVARVTFAFEEDWKEFNKFFVKYYKINFALATLFLSGFLVSLIHLARICYVLKISVDMIGLRRTLCLFKNSPLVFVHSAMTNLAIFYNIIEIKLEEEKEDMAMWAVVSATISTKDGRRCHSLPCTGLAPAGAPRFVSLPNILDVSALNALVQEPAAQDVPPTHSQLHTGHSSEAEKSDQRMIAFIF